MVMRLKRSLLLAALLVSLSAYAQADSLVICQMKYSGGDANQIAAMMGATIVDSMPGGIYLMSMQSSAIGTIPDSVNYLEIDKSASLPMTPRAIVSLGTSGREDWYRSQPAMSHINLVHSLSRSKGRGIVIADIDSGVDYGHPALRGALTSGYDFVAGRPYTAAPAGSLDQSTSSFLDQSSTSFLDQATSSFLDQASALFLDQDSAALIDTTSPAHGHGTKIGRAHV